MALYNLVVKERGATMNDTNKAIARRINKELKSRGWKQTELLRKILEYKYPNLNKKELYNECYKKKANFSTTLKGNDDRSFSKEDLYIISKIFTLPFEYIWFGYDKKSEFVPSGARYVAFQDNENDYRAYIAGLEYEDKVQYSDEFGFNLFDYMGQFNSINGYKFFEKNYSLNFDYAKYGQLIYINRDGYQQTCSLNAKNDTTSDNLLKTLIQYKDVKTFNKIFFDNSPLNRFDFYQFREIDIKHFSDDFLDALLKDDLFFENIFKIKEVDISLLNNHYSKGEKRNFVEPLFIETLFYALKNEKLYKTQLEKMLDFSLSYNKSQYEFLLEYFNSHKNEYSDVSISRDNKNLLISSRGLPMGNIFRIGDRSSDEHINMLINEIEKYAFNITHIKNGQEKSKEAIKISTPDNPLFIELCKNAINQNANYVPCMINFSKEFTYFRSFESRKISYNDCSELELIIEYLNKAQNLVDSKSNKVLVHGNLKEKVLMIEDGKAIGLSGWENCKYGSKYDDRIQLLMEVDYFIQSYNDPLERFIPIFDTISQGFEKEEKITLLDKTIKALNDRIQMLIDEKDGVLLEAYTLSERVPKLELFKKLLIKK